MSRRQKQKLRSELAEERTIRVRITHDWMRASTDRDRAIAMANEMADALRLCRDAILMAQTKFLEYADNYAKRTPEGVTKGHANTALARMLNSELSAANEALKGCK